MDLDVFEALTISDPPPPPPSQRPIFIHGKSERQYFAFPKHVMDYILQNPQSPKLWKKLIQTCKYFYDKNPIIVFPCLHLHMDAEINPLSEVNWKTCSTEICQNQPNITIDLFEVSCKIWITQVLDISGGCGYTSKWLAANLFKSDAYKISLYNQLLKFDEFLSLTSNVQKCDGFACIIDDKDEKCVSFEKIIESWPKLDELNFVLFPPQITPETVKKLTSMNHVKKLRTMNLILLDETFDFENFSKFMLENKQIQFFLNFLNTESFSEEYIAKVQAFFDGLKEADYGTHELPTLVLRQHFFE